MNKFFSHNLPWKVASLFLATILWLIVINTQNPVLPKEIKVESISVRGISELEAKGFVLQNEQELRDLEVSVIIRGPRLEMEKLEDESRNLDVRIDLTTYAQSLTEEDSESIEKIVPIEIYNNLPGIEIQEIRPENVSVIFEKEKTITKTIETNITSDTNSGYMTLTPVLNPSSVEISGPKSAIESVDSAVVDINVDDFSEDAITYTVPIRLLDKEGNEVLGARKSPEHIQVTLPIGKKKKVPIQPQFEGTLPPGYILSNVLLTPEEVTVVGTSKIVDGIEFIALEAISLDNMIQSETFNLNLLLPANVTPIDEIEGKAVVTLEIQKESLYAYQINTRDIVLTTTGLSENYALQIIEEDIVIELSGAAEHLLDVTSQSVEGIIDFSMYTDMEEGIHHIPIVFNTPENLKILSAPSTIQVNIKLVEQSLEPELELDPDEALNPDDEENTQGEDNQDENPDVELGPDIGPDADLDPDNENNA